MSERRETIFDHNPTDLELTRFGGRKAFDFLKERGVDLFNCQDTNYYQIGLLYSMRGDDTKANEYWSQIEHKEMLMTLWQDF